MKDKVLTQIYIPSFVGEGLCVKMEFLSLKCSLISTGFIPLVFLKHAVSSSVWKIFLLFILLPFYLQALPGADSRVKIRQNDAAVTVAVDKPMANKGEDVIITLVGIPNDKKATVTVGKAFGQDDITISNAGTPDSYIFTMLDYAVYIDVDIQPLSADPLAYPLTIETPGVTDGEVQVAVTGDGVAGDATAGYQAEAGTAVIVTLKMPLAAKLTLTKTEAFALDGSWRWTGLSGSSVVSTLAFDMPSTAIIIRFTIHKDTDSDNPCNPDNPGGNEGNPSAYYTVTLPHVKGVATDPVAGDYLVEPWSRFSFRLLLEKEYDQSVPVVKTSRGETLRPATDNVTYRIDYIRGDQEVFIEGIHKNIATANDPVTISGLRIRTTGGILSLTAGRSGRAEVYTFGGQLAGYLHLLADVESSLSLPHGVYFLRIGNESVKICM